MWMNIVTTHECNEVKVFHYRPGQALRAAEGWGSRISGQSAHEGGKVVSPTHRPSLPPGDIPDAHFCYMLNRSRGHNAAGRIKSTKNFDDPIGNEPATFRLVAQCLTSSCLCNSYFDVNILYVYKLNNVYKTLWTWGHQDFSGQVPFPILYQQAGSITKERHIVFGAVSTNCCTNALNLSDSEGDS
jgi:hypothetical protein